VTKNTVGRTFQPTKCPVHSSQCEVAVIGAGPYGLSAGAHLKAKGISARVFGEPMEFWAKKMPEGMLLRSPRVASNLSDPGGAITLEAYESASKTAPSAPVPLDTFVEYGRWFRHQLGSDLDERTVLRLDSDEPGFRTDARRWRRSTRETSGNRQRDRTFQEEALRFPESAIRSSNTLL
jgi:cation diffusion facilitator CzcD-associated flavoprotein CzcO